MITGLRISIGFFLLVLAASGSLPAQELPREKRDVEVRIFLIDIEEINNVSQSFVANMVLVSRWRDPGLAHDGPDSIRTRLDEIWHPRVQILNQQRLVQTFPSFAEVLPDGEVIYRQRYWGSFSQPLQLQDFPFDSQRLQFKLVEVGFGSIDVHLLASPHSGVQDSLSIPDWKIVGWDFAPVDLQLGEEMSHVNTMAFSLDVKRETGFFILKIFFPLILIVAMSWMVFWIDPSLAASQISVSVTAILTMIAYRFAIGGMLPRLNFLTSLDYFVMASTLIVFLALFEVVYTTHLSKQGQIEQARAIDRKARWIAPVIYAFMVIETLYLRVMI
jgi:hypothetical protein